MGRTLLCVGDYAESPYYVETIGLHIYSMEELCYYLTENAFLLDREIVNRELVDWIDEQCGCKQLGRTLYGYVNTQASVAVFVGTILEYVGYVSKQEIDKIQEYLKTNASLSSFEKEKAHADYMVSNKRYAAAQKEYRKLRGMMETEDKDFYARICHNEGVCYAGMMLYKQAAECFLESYEKSGRKESYEAYLAAVRMQLEEQDYVSFIADKPEAKDMALAVEARFKASQTQFQASAENVHLTKIFSLRSHGDMDGYETNMYHEINRCKDKYRAQMN